MPIDPALPPMNPRERLLAHMAFQSVDRCPIFDFGFWPETIDAWKLQGLPSSVGRDYATGQATPYLGMDPQPIGAPVQCHMFPEFPEQVIEDRGDHEVIRQPDGVTVLRKKEMGSIPMHLGHLLTDRASWEEHFKPRFDPSTPGRLGENFDPWVQDHCNADRAMPTSVFAGSLYGKLRDYMGMENLSMLVYDDPTLFEEMVETICVCTCETLKQAFARGLKVDVAFMWEDMCYNGGPLLGPEFFTQYLVPRYRRITDILYANGCQFVILDSDGKIDDLIPLWLKGGVHCLFPIEIGNWADPVDLRRRFGKDLLMMGGFDKHVLAQSRDAIDAEIARLTPLVEEGGFIPFCDRRVPPDVSLNNYLYYLDRVREQWGRGVSLEPMQISLLDIEQPV